MSRCLTERGVEHVVLERGRVGERWRSERWDSLSLLTPRWQSRLPGFRYEGPDPDGYMSRHEVITYLHDYARSFSAPLHAGVRVDAVCHSEDGFHIHTRAGAWCADHVVVATGHCDRPAVPAPAHALSPAIQQVVTTRYRNPASLREGGVLVVGASATGIQLAREIAASGRAVTLAAGRHTRLPRRYRGRDILAWFDRMGVLTETADDVWDIRASRRQPSLQLIGGDAHESLDLAILQQSGVRVTGRMIGAAGSRVYLADDLAASIDRAEMKMHEQLDRVDRFVVANGLEHDAPVEGRPRRVPVPDAPRVLDLAAEGIGTVLWATGFRRAYPWLRVPVLDARGEIMHDGGVTPVAGLYVLGLHFMRRRNSSFLDGVGNDASELAEHIVKRNRRVAVA